jgi:signal-transduction protein with cAMP-binding, CBS, and nucleotidyltransferase domain
MSAAATWRAGRHRRQQRVRREAKNVSTVEKILEGKGREILSIDADASVYDAAKQMIDANVGAMLVSADGRISGIVTERDYLRRVTLEGRSDKETPVREIMSSPLIVVSPDTSVEECMSLMTERRIRHLPVAEHGEIVGVISIGDVVKFTSKLQSVQIQYLTEYITAR